jgi:hypothetical protein
MQQRRDGPPAGNDWNTLIVGRPPHTSHRVVAEEIGEKNDQLRARRQA